MCCWIEVCTQLVYNTYIECVTLNWQLFMCCIKNATTRGWKRKAKNFANTIPSKYAFHSKCNIFWTHQCKVWTMLNDFFIVFEASNNKCTGIIIICKSLIDRAFLFLAKFQYIEVYGRHHFIWGISYLSLFLLLFLLLSFE